MPVSLPPQDYPITRDYADVIEQMRWKIRRLHDAFLNDDLAYAQLYAGDLFQHSYELTRLAGQLTIERNLKDEKGYTKWQPTQEEIIRRNNRLRKEAWEAAESKEDTSSRIAAGTKEDQVVELGTRSERNKPFENPPDFKVGGIVVDP